MHSYTKYQESSIGEGFLTILSLHNNLMKFQGLEIKLPAL